MTTSALEQALGGVPSIPTAFILDSDNNLIARHIGFREHEFWEAEVKALLDIQAESVSLRASLSGDRIELSWPGTASHWTLQAAANIAGPWSAILDSPEINQGRAVVALSPANVTAQFFRLMEP